MPPRLVGTVFLTSNEVEVILVPQPEQQCDPGLWRAPSIASLSGISRCRQLHRTEAFAGSDSSRRRRCNCFTLVVPPGRARKKAWSPAAFTRRRRERPAGNPDFGTTTRELLALLDWLRDGGCPRAALESTGEYWKPVYNLLEGRLELLLVNARHVGARRSGRGRRGVAGGPAAAWPAEGQFCAAETPAPTPRPHPPTGRLTSPTGHGGELAAKALEDANIKLASVATERTGVSPEPCWPR